MLNMIGKVIETAIYRHFSDMVEEYGLLPEGQMGNRIIKSIELAIRVIIEAIYIA